MRRSGFGMPTLRSASIPRRRASRCRPRCGGGCLDELRTNRMHGENEVMGS